MPRRTPARTTATTSGRSAVGWRCCGTGSSSRGGTSCSGTGPAGGVWRRRVCTSCATRPRARARSSGCSSPARRRPRPALARAHRLENDEGVAETRPPSLCMRLLGVAPAPPLDARRPRGALHALGTVRPEFRVSETLTLPEDSMAVLRQAGFAVAHFAPRRGIVRGVGAVAGLSSAGLNKSLIRDDAGQVLSIETDPNGYPGSLMGAVAVIRQTLMDARGYHDDWESYRRSPGKPRPDANESLAALEDAASGRQPVYFVAHDMLELLREAAIAREVGVTARLVGAGDEYK